VATKKTASSNKSKRRGEHLKPHHFKPGQSGNPSGLSKGSRNVKTAMLATFHTFRYKNKKAGTASFVAWGKDHPNAYYKLLASILPKDITVHPSEYAERLMKVISVTQPAIATALGEAIQELEDATTH